MSLNKHFTFMNRLFWLFALGLMLFGNQPIFITIYSALFIFMTARVALTPGDKSIKFWLIFSYLVILALQIIMVHNLIFTGEEMHFINYYFRRLLAVIALLLPVLVSRYIVAGKYAYFYLPSVEDVATIGLSSVADAAGVIKRTAATVGDAGKKLTPKKLRTTIYDLTKHNSFDYINEGTLTDAYFEKAAEYMDDPNIYIIVSKTGSPASEIISLFTRRQYNHASLSFDVNMETTISYNGGEKVYPPGLNMEMLEFFSKTSDSKILIYSLPCTPEKKRAILEKIRKINEEGSAYNILGLIVKRSYKPNIMFCSQFVYKMLEHVDLTYFTKPDGKVNPTDLIEQDYYKVLKFEKEIMLAIPNDF